MSKPDQIDTDLLPIFIEEGRDVFSKIHALWQALSANDQHVEDHLQQLKRYLHTIKGSARMVGAMVLGQLLHDFESFIKTISVKKSLTLEQIGIGQQHYDRAMQTFDELSRQPSEKITVQDIEDPLYAAYKKEDAFVRVGSGVIDQLLNQSGEIAIVRSYVENEVQVLKQVIQELALHIDMLDKRIRHIQMQTDTQVRTLRHKEATEKEFDWLEFDQFTYLQELTHQMASNISDISSLRKHLVWTMRNVQTHIDTQARLNKNLQADIMSTRMVMVQESEERLQRLVKQVADETHKNITLTLTGGSTLLDRHILNTMTTVFEHLIRNAIVHGIESDQERLDLHKSIVGHLHITVVDEAGEVHFTFTDDGRGVSLAYVQQRAVSLGLMSEEDELTLDGVLDIIAHPDFSTSKNVTELAGRGVGMDIVCAEVAQLGGRIQLQTIQHEGTTFIIHVPLTLATMRTVLIMIGGQTYGVPLNLVQRIVRKKDLMRSDNGSYQWHGKSISIAPLFTLLRQPTVLSQESDGMVLVLKQDSVQQGVLVDAVVGNQDVVLKPLSPSWVKVDGILGATILGSGQIVLIIQPNTLIQKYLTHKGKHHSSAPEIHTQVPKKIMVVDDALTVRRVLKKCLEKENYQVILAKDGQDALLHLPVQLPDLILLDVEMPRMDGFQLLKEIRSNKEMPYIPVIMITSRTGKKHQQRAKTLGADAYLGKPYDQAKLLILIDQLLQPKANQ